MSKVTSLSCQDGDRYRGLLYFSRGGIPVGWLTGCEVTTTTQLLLKNIIIIWPCPLTHFWLTLFSPPEICSLLLRSIQTFD